jgi:hypothetical protein
MSSSIADSTLLALSASLHLTENRKTPLKTIDDAELKSKINLCIRNPALHQAHEEALCILLNHVVET